MTALLRGAGSSFLAFLAKGWALRSALAQLRPPPPPCRPLTPLPPRPSSPLFELLSLLPPCSPRPRPRPHRPCDGHGPELIWLAGRCTANCELERQSNAERTDGSRASADIVDKRIRRREGIRRREAIRSTSPAPTCSPKAKLLDAVQSITDDGHCRNGATYAGAAVVHCRRWKAGGWHAFPRLLCSTGRHREFDFVISPRCTIARAI